jgi:hypothetical protein
MDEEQPTPGKTRGRGTPSGSGTTAQPHGGRIGNPPFVPTDDQRAQVRTLAKTFPPPAEHYLARLVGISRETLRKHFADDLELGRAEMLANVGAQMINGAINGAHTVKGDPDRQKFVLARMGGWSLKTEVTGKDGGPVRYSTYDFSHLTDDQKRAALLVLDQVVAQSPEDEPTS